MLGLVEETVLLLLREGGSFRRVPMISQRSAIAGAVLMELADADRVCTDPESLRLVDGTPTGDRLLDPTLREIAAAERWSTLYWIDYVAARADVIRAGALGRLIGKGILAERDQRVLGVFRSRRYPVVDSHVPHEIRLRLREALLGEDTPGSREVMLICLAAACGIFRLLLSRWERVRLKRRIEQICRLDPIGQTMLRAIASFRGAAIHRAPPSQRWMMCLQGVRGGHSAGIALPRTTTTGSPATVVVT